MPRGSSSARRSRPGALAVLVRWVLPIGLVIAGIVLLIISHGHVSGVQDNAAEANPFVATTTDQRSMLSAIGVAALVIALMVWLLNWMLRLNADEAGERAQEDDARAYFVSHGHWPGEGGEE